MQRNHRTQPLPDHIALALRQLFDNLDRSQTGFVSYDDVLCQIYAGHPALRGLIPGFLDSLRRVTPPNHLLTFERFCAAMRLAYAEYAEKTGGLRRNAASLSSIGSGHRTKQPQSVPSKVVVSRFGNGSTAVVRCLSDPDLSECGAASTDHVFLHNGSPSNANLTFEAQTASRESSKRKRSGEQQRRSDLLQRSWQNASYSSTKSTPTSGHSATLNGHHKADSESNEAAVSEMLLAWKRRSSSQRTQSPEVPKKAQKTPLLSATSSMANASSLTAGSHRFSMPSPMAASTASGVQSHYQNGVDLVKMRNKSHAAATQHNGVPRRYTIHESPEQQIPQRHKRMLNEERELLCRGREMAIKLEQFFAERLKASQTKRKVMGCADAVSPLNFAVFEQQLNYLRAHVTEASRLIVALVESSDKSFPSHSNFEMHRKIPQPSDDELVWMTRQNKMLTDEVSETKAKMNELEKKNNQLVQMLFSQINLIPKTKEVPKPNAKLATLM